MMLKVFLTDKNTYAFNKSNDVSNDDYPISQDKVYYIYITFSSLSTFYIYPSSTHIHTSELYK